MTYFLQDIAEYLFRRNKGEFHDTVVVFPNRRAQLFFNDHLGKITQKPIWSPDYYTISDFIRKISGYKIPDQLSLLFRLFKIYKEVTGSTESFDDFYYYCEMMLSDFDDIDKYMLNPELIFTNLADLKSLEDFNHYLTEEQLTIIKNFWNVYNVSKASPDKEKFIYVWNFMFRIYSLFVDSLQSESFAYEGLAGRKAISLLYEHEIDFLNSKQLVFVGFNALNRVEELLFDHFKKANALFFWDSNDSYLNEKTHEAGLFLRKYVSRYPHPPDFTFSSRTSELNLKTIAVPANISQAKSISQCLKEINVTSVNQPSQTALILADEALLPATLNAIPNTFNKVNISMGYPILETPVFSFLSAITDLHLNKKPSNTQADSYLFYFKDFFSLLKHNFFRSHNYFESLDKYEEVCQKENIIFINPAASGIQNPVFQQIFTPIDSPRFFGKYLREIIESIAGLIKGTAVDKPDNRWEIETLYHVHKVLTQFDLQLQESGLDFKLPTILNLLRRILSHSSIPFSGEPLSGLQVMGILETRTLDFENLVILSMNEGKFPKPANIPSFIPYSLREGFGLPTGRHQDAIYAYYFYRLLHRAKNVILVYNTKSEGLQRGEPSRFILQLQYNPQMHVQHLNMSYKILPVNSHAIRGINSGKVIDKLKRYILAEDNSFLSPSAINSFLRCQLQFYFKYIENLKEPENIEEQIEANVFGSILHKTMSYLYKDLLGKLVTRSEIESIENNNVLLESAINKAFGEEYFHRKEITQTDFLGRNIIIRKVIEQYVRGILEYDKNNDNFRLISLESPFKISLSLDDEKKVTLGGFIDRLDEKDGCLRVIDYKTGRRNNTFHSIDELFQGDRKHRNEAIMQTFIYSSMVLDKYKGKPIQPSLFFVRDVYKSDFNIQLLMGENRNKDFLNDFRIIENDFRSSLQNLLKVIFHPESSFKQTEEKESCEFCAYNLICMRK